MVEMSKAAIPFLVILIAMNSMFVFITFLPSNQNGDTTYDDTLGLSNKDISEISSSFNNASTDANNFRSDVNVGGYATTQPDNALNILGGFVFGVGGSILGAANALILFFKYLLMLAFGYFVWIDYFLPSSLGFGFFALAGFFKAFMFIIQVYAVLTIGSYLFSAGRKG